MALTPARRELMSFAGYGIGEVQEECSLLIDELRLAVNVNTRADLAQAEKILKIHSSF